MFKNVSGTYRLWEIIATSRNSTENFAKFWYIIIVYKSLVLSYTLHINLVSFVVEIMLLYTCYIKVVPKLTQDLNLIENTVFSLDYVIFYWIIKYIG